MNADRCKVESRKSKVENSGRQFRLSTFDFRFSFPAFAICLFSLLSYAVARGGPLFDDYLNFVRVGVSTGPGEAQALCEASQPIGQSFTLPPGTGEVYRIGVRPMYATWTTGEQVTMTLFDSPQRKHKLGGYTIDQATS